MVLTVTLNPLLEKRFEKQNSTLETDTAAKVEQYFAGGKGINVSRQLNHLGIKNHALTFLGGNNGKILRRIMNKENIEFSYIPTQNETRSADLIIDRTRNIIDTHFESSKPISENEVQDFIFKLEKMIKNSSVVVFSGSSPCTEADIIFSEGIKIADKYDKITVLDSYGHHLKNTLKSPPLVLHINKDEVESSLGLSLELESDYLECLKYINEAGVKLIFITNGSSNIYASKFGFNYKISPPKIKSISETGSGDAFTAGIIYGLERSLVFDEFIKIAIALGSANAERFDACNVTRKEFEKYLKDVKIEPIGKKVKLIDDSPNY